MQIDSSAAVVRIAHRMHGELFRSLCLIVCLVGGCDAAGTGTGPEHCADGTDDDGDGRVDCLDPSCTGEPGCAAVVDAGLLTDAPVRRGRRDAGAPDDASETEDAGMSSDASVPDEDAGGPMPVDAAAPRDAGSAAPILVSNDADFGGLMPTGLDRAPPSGTFDTDRDCVEGSVLGRCAPLVLGADRVDACVCRADTVLITDLRVEGPRALVILAWETIEIRGTLDVSAVDAEQGAGTYISYRLAESGRAGGRGGSYATVGGNGGTEARGVASLIPLTGGMRGQDACGTALAGGGGGSVQLSAGHRITITGAIAAGGGRGAGGDRGSTCNGGAGGGSGGSILIEAPEVIAEGPISANGGGGGSGGTTDFVGVAGENADRVEHAAGGSSVLDETCLLGDDVLSGAGGRGGGIAAAASGGTGTSDTTCFEPTYSGAGGGGGSAGRIRINSDGGVGDCRCDGDMSPTPSFGIVRR